MSYSCIIKGCANTQYSDLCLCYTHISKLIMERSFLVVCVKCSLVICPEKCYCSFHCRFSDFLAMIAYRFRDVVDWDKVCKLMHSYFYPTADLRLHPLWTFIKPSLMLLSMLKKKHVPTDIRKIVFIHYLLICFQNLYKQMCLKCYQQFEQRLYTCSKCR